MIAFVGTAITPARRGHVSARSRNQSSGRGRRGCLLKPDGGRSRLLRRRSRAGTDAAVHRHAVPADGCHSPRSAAAASPREAVASSPRARVLPQLVHSTWYGIPCSARPLGRESRSAVGLLVGQDLLSTAGLPDCRSAGEATLAPTVIARPLVIVLNDLRRGRTDGSERRDACGLVRSAEVVAGWQPGTSGGFQPVLRLGFAGERDLRASIVQTTRAWPVS